MEIWLKDFIYDYTGEKLTLTTQQRELIKDFEEKRFISYVKSRQIGFSTVLCNYLAYYLLNNDNKNIMFITFKSVFSKHKLKFVKSILTHINKDIIYDSTVESVTLKNGSKMMSKGLSLDGLCGWNVDFFVMEEVFDENFLAAALSAVGTEGRVIIGSSIYNISHALFSTSTNDGWTRKLLHYSDCELYDDERINNFRNVLGDRFKIEIDIDIPYYISKCLEQTPPKKEPKNKILQFRISDDLEYKLLEKLSLEDMTLSNYLRNLIKKDLKIN